MILRAADLSKIEKDKFGAIDELSKKGMKNFEKFIDLVNKWSEILHFDPLRRLHVHCLELEEIFGEPTQACVSFEADQYLSITVYVDPHFLNSAKAGELRAAAIHECTHMALRPVHRMLGYVTPSHREQEAIYNLESVTEHLTQILLKASL